MQYSSAKMLTVYKEEGDVERVLRYFAHSDINCKYSLKTF